MASRCVEAVKQEERDQGKPEQDVQYDSRADALGAEGKAGIGTRYTGLDQQPIAEGCSGRGPPGRDVAEGQSRQVDSEETPAPGPATRKHGEGELRVGDQRPDLQEEADHQVRDVDVLEGGEL